MSKLKNITAKIFRKSLQLIFGFDRWHIAPLGERPYAQDVISYCNKLSVKKSFGEIGCGLGDIVRNVDFENRVGFDMDPNVLRAARFLGNSQKNPPQFQVFIFPETPLTENFDVLALVNWIHHVTHDVLKKKIGEFLHNNINDGGRLIIDTVQDPAYKYNHDIKKLTTDLNCRVERIGAYARERELWAIIKR